MAAMLSWRAMLNTDHSGGTGLLEFLYRARSRFCSSRPPVPGSDAAIADELDEGGS